MAIFVWLGFGRVQTFPIIYSITCTSKNLTQSTYVISATNKNFLVISSQAIRTLRISEDTH